LSRQRNDQKTYIPPGEAILPFTMHASLHPWKTMSFGNF